MHFPETTLFEYFYWLINTPPIGGVMAGLVVGGAILAYILTLRWVVQDNETDGRETYAYPTPALHRQD